MTYMFKNNSVHDHRKHLGIKVKDSSFSFSPSNTIFGYSFPLSSSSSSEFKTPKNGSLCFLDWDHTYAVPSCGLFFKEDAWSSRSMLNLNVMVCLSLLQHQLLALKCQSLLIPIIVTHSYIWSQSWTVKFINNFNVLLRSKK